jgi:hypothetical protein
MTIEQKEQYVNGLGASWSGMMTIFQNARDAFIADLRTANQPGWLKDEWREYQLHHYEERLEWMIKLAADRRKEESERRQ